MGFLTALLDRRQARLRAERDHQLAMMDKVVQALETLAEGQQAQAAEHTKGLVALAEAQKAQADSFATWIKSFQTSEPPTSSVVREEDEYQAEMNRTRAALGLDPLSSDDQVPEEFRLVRELQRSFAVDVRGDTL